MYAALNKGALTAGSIAIAAIVNFDTRTFPLAFGNGDRNEVGSCYCFKAPYHENTSAIPALGRSCKDIKTTHLSSGDDLYLLDTDGGNQSNAFQAYCDMSSYNGGWTMCYTTDFKADPRDEIAYNPQNPYGTVGYRTDCNNILVSPQR